VSVNKTLQLQSVILPTDNNYMVSLGIQIKKMSLPDESEVGVILPDLVVARGAQLALDI